MNAGNKLIADIISTACRGQFAVYRIIDGRAGPPRYISVMKTTEQYGFTIYELLITMLVVGIILTIGVPNFSSFTKNSRITATANDLHSSFLLARSEAARSKSNITICASDNPMNPAAACGGSFDNGWIIFIDLNGDLIRAGAGENIIRAYAAIPSTLNIVTNGGSGYFGFSPTGLGRGDVGAQPAVQTARICDSRGNAIAAGGASSARILIVTPIGRATVLRDVDQINAAGGCP
jgi:type IV fimbrial biogenesis protein FimT